MVYQFSIFFPLFVQILLYYLRRRSLSFVKGMLNCLAHVCELRFAGNKWQTSFVTYSVFQKSWLKLRLVIEKLNDNLNNYISLSNFLGLKSYRYFLEISENHYPDSFTKKHTLNFLILFVRGSNVSVHLHFTLMIHSFLYLSWNLHERMKFRSVYVM